MNENGCTSDAVLQEVVDLAHEETTFDSGFIFNTECCRPHPLAVAAFMQFADRNLLKEQSVASRRMEREVINAYSSLFGSNDLSGKNGYVCSGGTEGNFAALWAAKAKLPHRTQIVASKYAHYSFKRFASPLGLELIQVPLLPNLQVDSNQFISHITDNTLMVALTAGDSVLGRIDPIVEVASHALAHGCFVHVDAAYGGYILPFLAEYQRLYRSLLSVRGYAHSITLDPHKYGLCPLGTGLVLFSDRNDLDRISFKVTFPPIESRTFQGSRSAGPTASVWAMTRLLGVQGYQSLASELLRKRKILEEELKSIHGLEFVIQPNLTSVGLCVSAGEEDTKALFEHLLGIGYKITPVVFPFALRLMIHHHTDIAHIEKLCDTIRKFMNK